MMHEGDPGFESALAECCERLRRGDSHEAAIASQPARYRAELARLAPLATRLYALGTDPSPAFRDRLLSRLAPSRPTRVSPRWAGPAALGAWAVSRPAVLIVSAVLVVLLALGGADAVAASESTLPDNPLYQVKVAREWVEVSLALDSSSRVGVHLRQIALRERELERALESRRSPRVVEAIGRRLADATARMVDASIDARGRGNQATAGQASAALRLLDQRLDGLSDRAGPRRRAALTHVREAVEAQRSRLGPE